MIKQGTICVRTVNPYTSTSKDYLINTSQEGYIFRAIKNNHSYAYYNDNLCIARNNFRLATPEEINAFETYKITNISQMDTIPNTAQWYVSSNWVNKSIAKYIGKPTPAITSEAQRFIEAYINHKHINISTWQWPISKDIRLATTQELIDYLPKDHPDRPKDNIPELVENVISSIDMLSIPWDTGKEDSVKSTTLENDPILFTRKTNKSKLITI